MKLREWRDENSWETYGFPNPSSTGKQVFPRPPSCSNPTNTIAEIDWPKPVYFIEAGVTGFEPATFRMTTERSGPG